MTDLAEVDGVYCGPPPIHSVILFRIRSTGDLDDVLLGRRVLNTLFWGFASVFLLCMLGFLTRQLGANSKTEK